jgi:hypothetical protein
MAKPLTAWLRHGHITVVETGGRPKMYYPFILNPFAGGFKSAAAAKRAFNKWSKEHGITIEWKARPE